MNKLLLAIPHSSTKLMDLELKNLLISDIKRESILNADLYTNELFDSFDLKNDVMKVVFDVSRYSIDVERYWDNDKEICYNKGKGKFYTKLDNGLVYRKENDITSDYNEKYFSYHNTLKDMIENKHCNFLIDCHSFNDFDNKYTAFCIGFNNDKTKPSKKLIDDICILLSKFNKTFSFNFPYSGSMTVNTNNEYKSLMIEVNKNLYLKNNYIDKKSDFYKTHNLITSILKICLSEEI